MPHRERTERPISISAPLHPDEDESIKPKVNGAEGWKSDATHAAPRRTMSLTRRLTGPLRLPHRERRERRLSISAPLHPDEEESINPHVKATEEWKSNVTPRRTMSLTRRLTRSLQHPARPARPLSMSSPLDQDDYEFIQPDVPHDEVQKAERMPRLGYPVQFVGFKAFAEKIERRREAREEGKREERRRWLTGSIRHVGNDEDAARTEHFKGEIGGW